ncbi:MAG: hypothetical protein H7X88_01615 [Gloeobacteraceae cyanobacterium ES-bin-316]|nr:hypothetical protein [Ferruginibacter sp.]
MDRVVTLSNKLQDQLAQNASVDQLLVTVQMLQSELMHKKQLQPKKENQPAVSIHIAQQAAEKKPESEKDFTTESEEKTTEILKVDEAELEAELEEIKRNAEAKNNMAVHNKPALLFDPVEDIPTLIHQRASEMPFTKQTQGPVPAPPAEIHEMISREQTASLNEKLKQAKIELGDSLVEAPIKDLRKAIGVNDRYLFINDLFRGDEVMYERSIKTINGFSIYPEAEYWIKRELKLKIGWDDTNEVVQQFDQLIRRRFI